MPAITEDETLWLQQETDKYEACGIAQQHQLWFLAFAQISLVLLVSLLAPCSSLLVSNSRKLYMVIVDSWTHWYLFWELWSWHWLWQTYRLYKSCAIVAPQLQYLAITFSTVSVAVSLFSNLISGYRRSMKPGTECNVFHVACCLLLSWIPRLLNACLEDPQEEGGRIEEVPMSSIIPTSISLITLGEEEN